MNKHHTCESRFDFVKIIGMLLNAFSRTSAPEKKWYAQGTLSLHN